MKSKVLIDGIMIALFLCVLLIGCSEESANPLMAENEEMIRAAPSSRWQNLNCPLYGRFRITREFGHRMYISGYGWSTHEGIDLAPSSSSAWYVVAPADGIIEAVGTGEWEGNYVVIRHQVIIWNRYRGYFVRELRTKYYHLNSVYSWVRRGATVHQGAVLGRVGSTGKACTGAHLHFEIREDGRYGTPINPREYIHFGDGKDLPHLV